jgi:hypothetical protein
VGGVWEQADSEVLQTELVTLQPRSIIASAARSAHARLGGATLKYRGLLAMVAVGLVGLGNYASAETASQPVVSKRQSIKDCMKRQMAANRLMSYIDASKLCANQSKSPNDSLASATPLK